MSVRPGFAGVPPRPALANAGAGGRLHAPQRFALATGALVLAMALLMLLAWLIGASFLRGGPAAGEMKANTAIDFAALGAALILTVRAPTRRRRAIRVLAGAAIAIGALTLFEYVAGVSLGIDQLLFHDPAKVGAFHPGRAAPPTVIALTLLGIALLFPAQQDEERRRIVDLASALAFALAFYGLILAAFGASSLAGPRTAAPIPYDTVIALVVLSAGVTAAHGRGFFVALLTGRDAGSAVARRLLPTVLPLSLVAWLALEGYRRGVYSPETALALALTSSSIVLVLVVLRLASRLNSAAAERDRAAARERRLAALVDACDDSMVSADAEGMITSWNPAAEKLYGYTESEVLGRPVSILVPPGGLAEQQRALDAVRRGEGGVRSETQRLRKDGSLVDASVAVSAIFDGGVLTGFCAVTHDITDHVRALRISEERYRLLFERNPHPMLAYDRETLRIVAVSNTMIETYGYSREEFLQMTIRDIASPADHDALERFVSVDLAGDAPGLRLAHALRHRHKDGSLVDVETTSDDVVLGERQCRIVLCQDVTERNAALELLAAARDQAVEASNLKSAFLANMSHEIRTPMNGVIGMNELLLETELTAEQRELAEQAGRSGEHALEIINDILDISKIEAGHLRLDLVDFDLHQAVRESCFACAAQAAAKGLRFDTQINPAVPQSVHGDGRRIQQVLRNIVANAVKFTSTGGITVEVDATPTPAGDWRVSIAIADTGVGMDPATLERVFEPFIQADVSTTRTYGGTGLGLAIVRELIELMDGTISAQSTPGEGSRFRVEIELAAPMDSAQAPRHELRRRALVAAPQLTDADAPLVLVAEDSKVNQIVAARALERCGCRVEVVDDGAAALAALSSQEFDAVLMDCQMPVLDGYAATAQLRREQGERRIPVIAMTAHAMDGDRARCLAAGMDDCITKPMRHAELRETLSRWIPAMRVVAATVEEPAA